MMPGNGAERNKSRPSRKLLCILFCDPDDTGLAAPRHAGRLADFILGWHKHATRGRKGEAGRWSVFSVAQILAGTGLSYNQWRDAKPWLEGAARIVGGSDRGKRAIWTQPTVELQRFTAGEYPDKKAAKRALEALRQAPVEPGDTTQVAPVGATQVAPVGATAGQNQGQQGGQNLMHSPLSSLPPTETYNKECVLTHATKNQDKGKEKEKPGKTPPSDKGFGIGPESKDTIPAAAGTMDLESLAELIYAAKAAQIEASYGLEPLPASSLTEDDEAAKKLMLKKLKRDLQLFPDVPIPEGCQLVHPMRKDPIRWVTLSNKVKASLYHGRFLPYLENWKNKHAASLGAGPADAFKLTVPQGLYDCPELAALDAELAALEEDEAA